MIDAAAAPPIVPSTPMNDPRIAAVAAARALAAIWGKVRPVAEDDSVVLVSLLVAGGPEFGADMAPGARTDRGRLGGSCSVVRVGGPVGRPRRMTSIPVRPP